MDGRLFSGTKVEAYIADGGEKFKKTNEKKVELGEEDQREDDGKRLEQFGSWLEEDRADASK